VRQTRILFLTCLLFTVPAGAFAQAAPQQAAQTTTQQTPFTKELKKTVGLLTVTYNQDGKSWKDEGTCFFIFYPDERVGKDQGFAYLVTNRHVAMPGIEDGSYEGLRASKNLQTLFIYDRSAMLGDLKTGVTIMYLSSLLPSISAIDVISTS
jgi:hypothetical protein